MISFRQLWFESYTIAMTELEERVKKTPLDTPRVLPLAERMVRIEKQKKDYPGLVFDQFLEPAHVLTDKAHAMIEDGVLQYIPLTNVCQGMTKYKTRKQSSRSVLTRKGT